MMLMAHTAEAEMKQTSLFRQRLNTEPRITKTVNVDSIVKSQGQQSVAAGHPSQVYKLSLFIVCFLFQFCFLVLPCCFVFKEHQFETNYAPLCYKFTSSSLNSTYPESTSKQNKKSQCEPGNPKADGQLSTPYCEKPADRFIYICDFFFLIIKPIEIV